MPPPFAGPIIAFENVHKSYRGVKAVDGVGFQVAPSSCFGLLGPNGAGKSTIMRMLYGTARRDPRPEGSIRVFGCDPERQELIIKAGSGVVSQDDNLDEELDVTQNLVVFSKLYGIVGAEARRRIAALLELMELGDKRTSAIRELSGGMKRRLVIARALLNEPRLLILDEPTTGLDPQVRHSIWDKLRQLRRGGLTIVLCTHYMEEAFQLCDDVLILDRGKSILHGNPKELVEKNIERHVLEIVAGPAASEVTARLAAKGVRVDASSEIVRIYADSYDVLKTASLGLSAGDFHLRPSTLEDLFLKATGRSLHAAQ